ncbi:MAG TPA: glycoside hydrolase family 43 protein [Acidimicrobiales bacterium]|nr:glycoside hydrolase family 43 protein [Acidimicrobiales bacterium]
MAAATTDATTTAITAPRRVLASLAALVALMGAVASVGLAAAAPAGATNWAPVHNSDFPDPSVVEYLGVYYGFATQNFAAPSQTINIQVSTSSNGVNWSPSNGVDALPQVGSWARPGNTWAPSVVHDDADNDFVMYYTATERLTGDQCIGMATSIFPTGPYHDNSSQPMVCQNGTAYSDPTVDGNLGGSIDPDIFKDSVTGDVSLIWKSDGNHLSPPVSTILWSVPLDPTSYVPDGSPTELMQNDAGWQSGIVEGPDMVETTTTTPGTGGGAPTTTPHYTLFYSGSDEGASTYSIGWASCPSGPAAGCTDESRSVPLLVSAPGMSGPGGPEVYSLPSSEGSQMVMAFAAWQGSTIGYLSCGIRPMYLADLTFQDDSDLQIPSLVPTVPTASPAASPTCPTPPKPAPGYWQVGSDGGIFSFGAAQFYGSTGSMHLNKPVVGMAATPSGNGYWLVASDGGVFAYGDAQFYGSTGSITLNKPIIGLIPTLDGGGYWLIASDGGVFAYGDAKFYGSTASDNLAYPITAAAPSFLGGGYWMVDANGQVFNFGNAPNEGQPSEAPGGYRITGMAGTQSSNGYWLASANGNVAVFGNAAPYGSMVGTVLNAPVVGMASNADATGYWLQGADGGIFTFGHAEFYGSMGGRPLNAPMVGIAAT